MIPGLSSRRLPVQKDLILLDIQANLLFCSFVLLVSNVDYTWAAPQPCLAVCLVYTQGRELFDDVLELTWNKAQEL